MIKLTSVQAEAVTFDDSAEFEVVDEGRWMDNGKYDLRDVVFSKEGKYYLLSVSRTGSYHTDWYYDWEYTSEYSCPEVHQVTITTTIWEKV